MEATVTAAAIRPPPTEVPEPATLALFGFGAAALFAGRKHIGRRKS